MVIETNSIDNDIPKIQSNSPLQLDTKKKEVDDVLEAIRNSTEAINNITDKITDKPPLIQPD